MGNNEEFSKIPNLEEGLAAWSQRLHQGIWIIKADCWAEMLRRNV